MGGTVEIPSLPPVLLRLNTSARRVDIDEILGGDLEQIQHELDVHACVVDACPCACRLVHRVVVEPASVSSSVVLAVRTYARSMVKVATCCCVLGRTAPTIHLFLRLLQGPPAAASRSQVVGNENNEHQIDIVKDIGMGIIHKCDGLPLAVKVMGGLLRQKRTRRGDWDNVLNDSVCCRASTTATPPRRTARSWEFKRLLGTFVNGLQSGDHRSISRDHGMKDIMSFIAPAMMVDEIIEEAKNLFLTSKEMLNSLHTWRQ
nr:unnamed protein product [Digitaria exilis]